MKLFTSIQTSDPENQLAIVTVREFITRAIQKLQYLLNEAEAETVEIDSTSEAFDYGKWRLAGLDDTIEIGEDDDGNIYELEMVIPENEPCNCTIELHRTKTNDTVTRETILM